MNTIQTSNMEGVLSRLQRLKIPHHIASTNKTDVVTVFPPTGKPYRYLQTFGGLKKYELRFIKETKKEGEAAQVKPEGNTAKDIFYYRFRDLKPGVYTGVCELDVNSAYWLIAYRRGIITRRTYEKGLNDVSKMARLVALGSLATVKRHYEYCPETGKYIDQPAEYNPRTRSYFFDIAKELDVIMAQIIQDYQVLFYWVDAFILFDNHAGAVRQALDREGLPCKLIKLDRVVVTPLKSGRKAVRVETADGKVKPFILGNPEQTAEAIIKAGVGIVKKFVN